MNYTDPSGHGTTSAADKVPDEQLNAAEQAYVDQAVEAMTQYMEQYSSAGIGGDGSNGSVSNLEAQRQALREIVGEVNERGGASPDESIILYEWANEYGVDYNDLGVQSQLALPAPEGTIGGGDYSSLRDLMTPKEVARYNEHWVSVAENISNEALDNQIAFIKSGIQ